jgi:hypothetical protein
VVRTNPQSAMSADPYGDGWLLDVRSPEDPALEGLLSGASARAWLTSLMEDLQHRAAPGELVLQDGGEPVCGLAKAVDPDGWAQVARRYLLIFR